ncbi:retrovirus-related pol polyprotein from transposon TNT 1-94 [Tanacetum coccineum]
MHNNIMAAGSRDRPPMLATGRYAQWRSRFLRYIDTRPNGDALRKCILKGPYTPTIVTTPAVPATEDSPAVPEQTTVETVTNMTPENRAHFESEKEAIHLILTGIGDEIYSTVDACQTAQEMWEAIERLQQVLQETLQTNQQQPLELPHTPETECGYYSKVAIKSTVWDTCLTEGNLVNMLRKAESQNGLERLHVITRKDVVVSTLQLHGKDPGVPNADSGTDDEPLEQDDQNDVGCDDERVALANLIANLKLDVDENKKIQKQLKKANATLTQELTECKSILAETSRTLGESNSIRDSCLVALQNKQTEFERYKAFNDRTVDYDKLEHKLNEAQTISSKRNDINEGDLKYDESLEDELDELESDKAQNFTKLLSEQTEFVSKEIYTELLQSFAKLEKHSISLEIALQDCQEQLKNDTVCKEKASNVFRKDREQYFEIQDLKAQLQDKNIAISELKKLIEKCKGKSMDTKFDKPSVVRQPNAQRIPKPSVLGKPAPFSNSLERKYFAKKKSVLKTNESEGLSKPVTPQNLPQTAKQAICNTHPIIVDSGCTKHMTAIYLAVQFLLKNTWVPFVLAMTNLPPILGYREMVQGNIHDQNGLLRPNNSQLQSVSWLKHHQLKHGYGIEDYVKDQLCSSCEVSKAKRSSFKSKTVPSSKGRLNLLHMDLCGPMRVASINGKKYILVIVDDYSRYTWTLFLRSKDETPEVLKDFLTMIQRNLQAPVFRFATDRCTESLNKTLNAFLLKEEGIERIKLLLLEQRPEHKRRLSKDETALINQSSSQLMRETANITHYIDRKPSIKHLHIFGCTCYLTRDGENLDKMKEKGDSCILVGYSTQSKGYRVYNKRTRLIVESIHLRFDEIKEISETSVANDTSGLVPQRQKASDYDNPDPAPELQNVFPSADTTVPSQQELDLLFGPLYDEFFNDGTSRVNKSSSPTDNSAPQDTNPSTNIHPTSEPTTPTNVHAEENNDDQAEFTNPFCTPVQEAAESSSRNLVARVGGCQDFVAYAAPQDADHADALDTRKSNSGEKQFLGDKLSHLDDKEARNCTAMSSAEANHGVICQVALNHSNIMQNPVHLALPYEADPNSVSLHKGTALPEKGSVSRQAHSSQAVNKSPTHYPCDSARTFRVMLFSIHNDEWKSFQCHHQTALRIHKDGDGDASFQLKSDSLPHAHAQTTKTFYKHQDSRIMKAQELNDKVFRTNSDIQDLPSKISSLSREIVSKLSR